MKNYVYQNLQIAFIVKHLQQRNIKTSEKINNGFGVVEYQTTLQDVMCMWLV